METNDGKAGDNLDFQFKSYYVVWKRFLGLGAFVLDIKFKSYYVVWKLTKRYSASDVPGGLNRTMQYGNRIYDAIMCSL